MHTCLHGTYPKHSHLHRMAKGKRERAPRALVVRGDVTAFIGPHGSIMAHHACIQTGSTQTTIIGLARPAEVREGAAAKNVVVNNFGCVGDGATVVNHFGRGSVSDIVEDLRELAAGAVYGFASSGNSMTVMAGRSKRQRLGASSNALAGRDQPFDQVTVSGPARVVFTSAELLAADVVVRVSGTARVTLPAGRVRHIDAAASGNSAIVGPADGFLRADTATLTATGRATIHGVRVMDAADASAGPAAAATVRAAEDAAVSARGRVTVTHDQ